MSIRFEAEIMTENPISAGKRSEQVITALPSKQSTWNADYTVYDDVISWSSAPAPSVDPKTQLQLSLTPILKAGEAEISISPEGQQNTDIAKGWSPLREFLWAPFIWLLKLSPKLRVLVSPNAAAIQMLQVIFQISLPFNSRYQGKQGCKIKN